MFTSTQGRLEHIGVALQQGLAVDVYVRHEEKESRVELHPTGLADPGRLEPMRGTKARWLAVGLIAHCGGPVGLASSDLAGSARQLARQGALTTINDTKEAATMKVTLTGPEFAGEYRVVEHRVDGSLVLRPDGQPELLSEVIEQTRGQAFRDEELLVHLDRIAATEDDLPSQDRG